SPTALPHGERGHPFRCGIDRKFAVTHTGVEGATPAPVFASGGPSGEAAQFTRQWSRPTSPPEGWPQSLQTAVSILLSSRFPMWMAWGPELTFFCNDAYRRD
ncbi:hypothetical protein C6A85_70565, partial [Mycobacterium sp. ITM-2017-0098]